MTILKTDELLKEFKDRGFHYNEDLLFNYYISLITKPFVILTGISGSGKSKIAEIFAEIVGDDHLKSYELIPVKPNWRDNKGLFGYHNLIDDSYSITPLIKLFIRALKHPDKPFFLILDEMNIAKTEHYFADYLSLLESRRMEVEKLGPTLDDLKQVSPYAVKITLSEAIILSAIDINKKGVGLKIEEYRNNRFSCLWKEMFFGGKTWTNHYRSEFNQGNGRLAHRVFKQINEGVYAYKDKSEMTPNDVKKVEKLEEMYNQLNQVKVVVQENIVLHNSDRCLGVDGANCECTDCPYKNSEKYMCDKLYDPLKEKYLIPAELPIPLNVFTIGTVNIDETTYMFSPKVLDRSNVIEFNEVDFSGIYNLTKESIDKINSVAKSVTDNEFFFDSGTDMPSVSISIARREDVNQFISLAEEQFNDLIHLFATLKKYNLHFGYRVMNEIGLYMCNVIKFTSYTKRCEIALDNQILQKILPKLYGSYDKIWNPLIEILGCLLKAPQEWSGLDIDTLIEELKKVSTNKITRLELNAEVAVEIFKYPKSAIKIVDMLRDLDDSGFATFIK